MTRIRDHSALVTAWLVAAAIIVGPYRPEPAEAAVPSGFEGGGTTNVVAVDPHGTGVVVAGADIGGLQVGAANGASFLARNGGAQFLPDMSVATVVFATRTNNLYAGTGSGTGPASGFWRSIDSGQTWSRLGTGDTLPDFAGSGVAGIRARATGRLIALDESTNPEGRPGIIYAATTRGMMRSTDGGQTWALIGLADGSRSLRGIALDPADPARLYVASHRDGVYLSANANAPDPKTVEFAQISGPPFPGSPVNPQELLVLADQAGSSLYVAATDPDVTGVYEYRGSRWVRLGQDALSHGALWYDLDGYSEAGVRHLIVGCHGRCPKNQSSGLYESLFRSDDGGESWASMVTQRSSIHPNEIGGPGGPEWWFAERNGKWILGGPYYKVAQVAIDPSRRERVFLAGSSGLWRTDDRGASWYPVVKDMLVASSFAVATDPNAPARVYAATADSAMVYSTDRGVTVHQSRPKVGGTNGTAVAVDPVTGRIYLSLGQSTGTANAELFSSTDPSVGGSWKSERLSEAPGEGGLRADGLTIGHVRYPVIVAAVVGSGIWRKVVKAGPGSGTWQQTLVAPDFGIEVRASSVPGSNLVYVYDHISTGGLWLSQDGGQSWGDGPIWTNVSPPGITGFMALDPSDPTRIYVSTNSGLFVITDTTGTPTATKLPKLPDPTPGPVAVQNDGVVWVSGKTGDLIATDLYRSTDGGATWQSVGDDVYRNTAAFPHALTVASDGYLYAAMRGNAMVVNPPIIRD